MTLKEYMIYTGKISQW